VRIDTPEGRYYETPAGRFPSVTTILRATAVESPTLADWKRRATADELARVEAKRDRGATRGTELHAAIEAAVEAGTSVAPSPWAVSLSAEISTLMGARSLGSEVEVWHDAHQYAGTLDQISEVPGVGVVLWDWKSWEIDAAKRSKTKRREWIEDHLIQCRLYAKAWGRLHRRKVDQIRVAIARCVADPGGLRPMPAQVFAVDRRDPEYRELWRRAVSRLDAFAAA
jgi:hypothetical protein